MILGEELTRETNKDDEIHFEYKSKVKVMAVYTANNPVKTLTIHKPGCRFIPKEHLKPCGCGDTGARGNQRWYCEEHITIDAVNKFMNGRFWAILLCDQCYRER